MSEEGKFFRGFFFGGLIGAVLALLFAPKTGREMREDIRRKSREIYEEADEQLAEVKKQATEIMEEGRRQADLLRQQAEAKMKEARAAAEQMIAEGRRMASELSHKPAGRLSEVRAQAEHIIEEGKKRFGRGKDRVKSAMDAGSQAYREEVEGGPQEG